MKIDTSLELVRYIRHHLAGSEWQDIQAVEDFVKMKSSQRLQARMELMEELLKDPVTNAMRIQELLHDFSA